MSEIPTQPEQEPRIDKSQVLENIQKPRKRFGWKTYVLLTTAMFMAGRWARNEVIEHRQEIQQAESDERLRHHYALAKVTHILIDENILVNSLNGRVSPLDNKEYHWFDVEAPKEGGYVVTSTEDASDKHVFETPKEVADFLREGFQKNYAFLDFLLEMQDEIDAENELVE